MPRVGIVGVGLIGRAWANVFARAGWDVRVYDADDATRDSAPELIRESLQDLARHGLVDDPAGAAGRVSVASSLSVMTGSPLTLPDVATSGPSNACSSSWCKGL